MKLSDAGFVAEALEYVEAIKDVMKASGGAGGPRSPFSPQFVHQLEVFEDRLRNHTGKSGGGGSWCVYTNDYRAQCQQLVCVDALCCGCFRVCMQVCSGCQGILWCPCGRQE